MKITRYSGADERRILAAMVSSRPVLARVAAHWDKDGLFTNRWCNVVAGWCVDFVRRYDDAPGANVEGLFTAWAQSNTDDATVTLVEQFLSSLDYEDAEKVNADHIIDAAAKHFSKAKAKRAIDAAQGFLDRGEFDKADEELRKYRRIEMGLNTGVDVLADEEAVKQALDETRQETLISYPGDLGRFFGNSLARESFVAFEAPEKRGKTWALLDLAWRGMLSRRNVAFFEIGDMTRDQIMRRFIARAARRPLKAGKKYRYPVLLEADRDGECRVEFEDRASPDKPLHWKSAVKAFDKIRSDRIKSDRCFLKLYTAPAGTVSVEMVDSEIQRWADDGWAADVVVIDYADLLKVRAGADDMRDRVNESWVQMRALSQRHHALVVTATQANRASYNAKVVAMEHASEDKRKMAHVTGMVGINQSHAEKALQVVRYNWVVLREDEFVGDRCVFVAQCLPVANPCVRSCFPS